MEYIECPFFDGIVELTDEREDHIAFGHPRLLPAAREELISTVMEPEDVLPVLGEDAHLFVRWSDILQGGRYIVVVVVTDPAPNERHWIVTAYTAKRPPEAL